MNILLFLGLFICYYFYIKSISIRQKYAYIINIHPLVFILYKYSIHGILKINNHIQTKRQSREIPKLIDFLNSYLKSGIQLSQALIILYHKHNWSQNTKNSIYKINRYYMHGMPIVNSIKTVRNSIYDYKMNYYLLLFLTTLEIGNISSGNLVSILEKLKIKINDKIMLDSKMSATTAQIRFQSYVIGVSPLFISIVIWLISPSYILFFFDNEIGIILLFTMILLNAVGFYILKKISRLN